jgi:hypothetical protein
MNSALTRFLDLNHQMAPHKLDAFLYVLDLKLTALPISFVFAGTNANVQFASVERFVYYLLPFATTAAYAAHARINRGFAAPVLIVFTANLLVGYALYLFYPASGPVYAFPGSFPHAPPADLKLAPMTIDAPANAMPSLHVSSALLIWWSASRWRWASRTAFGYLVLTILATMGLGEHYLIDLVVAVPYALFIQSLGVPEARQKVVCAGVGLGLTAFWLLSIRYSFATLASSTWLLVILAVGTVALSLGVARRIGSPSRTRHT